MSDRRDSTDPFDWSNLQTLTAGGNALPTSQRKTAGRKTGGTWQLVDVVALLFFLVTVPLIIWTVFRDRSDEESLQELQDRLRYQEIISAPKRQADELYEQDPELRRLKQEMASDDPEVRKRAHEAANLRMNRMMTDKQLEFYNADPADLLRRDDSP